MLKAEAGQLYRDNQLPQHRMSSSLHLKIFVGSLVKGIGLGRNTSLSSSGDGRKTHRLASSRVYGCLRTHSSQIYIITRTNNGSPPARRDRAPAKSDLGGILWRSSALTRRRLSVVYSTPAEDLSWHLIHARTKCFLFEL